MSGTRRIRAYAGVVPAFALLSYACAAVVGIGDITGAPDGGGGGSGSGSAPTSGSESVGSGASSTSGSGSGNPGSVIGSSGTSTSGSMDAFATTGSSSGAASGTGSASGSVSGSSSGSGSGTGSASGSVSGSSSGSGSSGSPSVTGPPPTIPAVSGTCPILATGNITVLGQNVVLAVGTKQTNQKGAVFFYWHGTGSSPSESTAFFGPETTEITSQGGIVVSFDTSTKMGTDTGDALWYTGDFAMADQILACAVQQLNIDTRRIYTGGCSGGGLQASRMLYDRSSYIAAVMPNSGGIIFTNPLQDTSHVPSLITTHGKMGTDMVVIDFATSSLKQDEDVFSKGGFAVDCDHGGGHCAAPAADVAAQWQFCKDHPFGVSPEPYAAGLPSSFPAYCTIIRMGPPAMDAASE